MPEKEEKTEAKAKEVEPKEKKSIPPPPPLPVIFNRYFEENLGQISDVDFRQTGGFENLKHRGKNK